MMHSPLHSQRHSPESSLPIPCRNHSPFLLFLPIPYHFKVKSNRKLFRIEMQHNSHPTFDFHTLTSNPFILAKRSTFILALHPFYSKLTSTTSPPHSLTPLPYKQPNSSLFPSTLQNSQNTPISFNLQFHYPSPIFFIPLPTPIQQSPPICFQSQKPLISPSPALSHKLTTPFLSHSPIHL